jgi:hypothetical protein
LQHNYDDASTLAGDTGRPDVNDKETSQPDSKNKKDAEFDDDGTRTLVGGEGRRDRNGKLMTKKELVAEGIIRVIVACNVM